jgi:hypothetical protein
MKNQDSNNEMQNNSENPFETLIKAYPEYKENKEKFKEKYPSIYITMEAVEKKAEEDIEQEYIRRNMVFNYSLKKHFGLLTKEEIQRQIEVDKLRAKYMIVSYELYVEMGERNTKYFDDVRVLLTYEYPYYYAYKIGSSIEDSEFIECSLYTNDIYKIIAIFLETGEKVHDV